MSYKKHKKTVLYILNNIVYKEIIQQTNYQKDYLFF